MLPTDNGWSEFHAQVQGMEQRVRAAFGALVARKSRCRAYVYGDARYLYTGRGRGGFEMLYTRKRCQRMAPEGGVCAECARRASNA